ncbi:AMP-binding enzyme [Bradyrhizobium sp. SHOUNA76]|uniref:AMP-binding enzyme n=1 Tax=Bradyrhizobium sp. SHOUNA76 TaxID=2908927 RepID=UPI001FF2311A|nr:hypothetical protein [Bradyrhizobium sp. SHOUNA76]MCJ9700821.1 hypothetical protein [Bradyrhizobium sp. SHOUNA76]
MRGVRHPYEEYGETVCAFVQSSPGISLTSEDIQQYLRGRMAGYKIPKVVEFRPALPREDSGEIFKRKLRDPFWVNAGRRI